MQYKLIFIFAMMYIYQFNILIHLYYRVRRDSSPQHIYVPLRKTELGGVQYSQTNQMFATSRTQNLSRAATRLLLHKKREPTAPYVTIDIWI